MKTADLNRRRSLENTGKKVEYQRVDFEMVTDEICQVLVYVDFSAGGVEAAAWQLAHVIDVVAAQFDRWDHPSFMAFTHSFSAAWDQVRSRPLQKRMKAADLGDLPPFLGGSSDPPGE